MQPETRDTLTAEERATITEQGCDRHGKRDIVWHPKRSIVCLACEREGARADEREACAKVAKGRHNKRCGPSDASASDGYNDACDDIHDAIRARSTSTTEGQQHGS